MQAKEIFPDKQQLANSICFENIPIYFQQKLGKLGFQVDHHGRVHKEEPLMKAINEIEPSFSQIAKEYKLSGKATLWEVKDVKDNEKFLNLILKMCIKASNKADGFNPPHNLPEHHHLTLELIDKIDLELNPESKFKLR